MQITHPHPISSTRVTNTHREGYQDACNAFMLVVLPLHGVGSTTHHPLRWYLSLRVDGVSWMVTPRVVTASYSSP